MVKLANAKRQSGSDKEKGMKTRKTNLLTKKKPKLNILMCFIHSVRFLKLFIITLFRLVHFLGRRKATAGTIHKHKPNHTKTTKYDEKKNTTNNDNKNKKNPNGMVGWLD